MSISDENTNELDSYGVWVKNSSEKADLPEANENAEVFSDESLDLPDFDNADFSSDVLDDFSSDDDTTLSADELANITNGSGDISIEETPSEDSVEMPGFEDSPALEEPTSEDTPSFDDISFDETTVEETPAEESVFEETPAEETPADDFSTEEVSLDDFDIGEPSETPAAEESAPVFEQTTNEESSGEEEISLDDFMDGGFSDESVAAGNNGFEPGKEPIVAESEEVSLDDFVDMSEFDSAPASEASKEDEIVEEGPIDMDISFDESVDTVATEENVSVEDYDDEDEDIATPEQSFETEEVSIDDFGADIPTSDSSSSSESIATEDVDLSDFGIDAEAEETPIVQDVEEAKNKETVVDYDLSIGDENTSAAPVVNEIRTDSNDNVDTLNSVDGLSETPVQAVTPGSEVVSSSLLQQIVNDLSGLKDEINQLKSNLAEIKANEKLAASEPVIEDSFEEETKTPESNGGGFFDLDDTDETIALSGDELDNILNSAEFSEIQTESDEPETASEDLPDEFIDNEIVPDSNPEMDNTQIEETFIDETSTQNDDLPNEIEEEGQFGAEETDFSESASIEENIFEETPASEESISTEEFDIVTEEESIEDTINENLGDELSTKDDISFDYENENLEEPSFEDEIAVDGEDELPDEISVPKDNDILVETSNDDFMDSVKDTTKIEEAAIPDAEESNEVAFDTVDSFLDKDDAIAEETAVEEPIVEETAVEPDFNEVDNLDSNLSESNLDYLTTKEENTETEESSMNSDLKKDIKSVLLYMDQLLENLPEEKIVEFAKSDEFSTYKKLFTELGLS